MGKSKEDHKLKLHFLDSLVTSSQLFNAGTWSGVTEAQLRTLAASIMSKYRAAANLPRYDDTTCPDSQVLVAVQRAEVSTQLRVHRLRVFGRLVHFGSDTLKALVALAFQEDPQAWLRQ
eukprot:5027757-Pyramimonas_sp.AAC.1